jgi:hypothetical protein
VRENELKLDQIPYSYEDFAKQFCPAAASKRMEKRNCMALGKLGYLTSDLQLTVEANWNCTVQYVYGTEISTRTYTV